VSSIAGGDAKAVGNCVLGGLDSNPSDGATPRAEVRAPSIPAQPPASGHLLPELGGTWVPEVVVGG